MTRDDHARKAAIRARMASTHEPYSVAARQAGRPPRPATGIGTPPRGWPAWAASLPATVAVWRDRDGVDEVAVVASTGRRLGRLSVPHVPTETLLAEYAAASLTDGAAHRDGPPDHDRELAAALGRPDLTAHRLGYITRGPWHPWTDGSWRSPATPADTQHTVRAVEMKDGLHLTVLEHPGDQVVAESTASDTEPNAALNRLGFTATDGEWIRLPSGVRYARARPGHLAERNWWIQARVRALRAIEAAGITLEAGQELVVTREGRAGAEVHRNSWTSDLGADIANGAITVVEVLEEHPPTWQAAALTPTHIIALIGPYHPDAEPAVAAWAAAGLHVSQAKDALVIRTPAPELHQLGRIARNYWSGNVHNGEWNVPAELSGHP